MANYYGNARSNYFKVKDEAAFMAAMEPIPDIEVHGDIESGFCILVADGDYGGWPSMSYDEDTDVETEIDLPLLVSEHLKDGAVAIFMESGAEKLRYVTGYTEAINSKGERTSISLTDIYEAAADLTDTPEDITPAEY